MDLHLAGRFLEGRAPCNGKETRSNGAARHTEVQYEFTMRHCHFPPLSRVMDCRGNQCQPWLPSQAADGCLVKLAPHYRLCHDCLELLAAGTPDTEETAERLSSSR